MAEKCGGFVIHNGHSIKKQKGQYSSPNRSEMIEVLIFYKDIEFIRSSIRRGKNYIDYIAHDSQDNKEKNRESYFTKRVQLYKLIETLPNYFIQVNQSEIINIFHIVGRSGKYLFTEKKEFKITDTYLCKVNCKLSTFFD